MNSVNRAIAILRFLSTHDSPIGVTAIAKTLGQNTSTCLNVVRTLVGEGLVDFDSTAKTYRLNARVVELARPFIKESDPFEVLKPAFSAFSSTHKITCALWQLDNDDSFTLIGNVESDSSTRIGLRPGQRVPMLAGAIGRCAALVRNLSQSQIKQHYRAIRWQNPCGITAYMKSLTTTAEQGWALDNGEFIMGMTAVAGAIPEPQGPTRLFISNVSLVGQFDQAQIDFLGTETLKLAKNAARLLNSLD